MQAFLQVGYVGFRVRRLEVPHWLGNPRRPAGRARYEYEERLQLEELERELYR